MIPFENDSNKSSKVVDSYGIPLTLSLCYRVGLTESFHVIPKLGLGYMLVISKTSSTTDYASIYLGRPSLEIAYYINDSFFASVEAPFLFGLEGKSTKVSYFFVPNLGLGYKF